MPIIKTEIFINAPRKIVFDLARSIDFHKESTRQTKEEAIAGRTSGLIELDERVTWRARHFGIWLTLESKITEMDFPNYFVDEMQKGSFKSFRHEHIFEDKEGVTIMKDIFDYQSPLGIIRNFVDWLFLKRYLINFLLKRNQAIKIKAEF